MKYLVLVVDDQYSERLKGYKNLEKKVSALGYGFEIELDFVEDPNKLGVMTQKNFYSAAIVDAVLDEGWKTFNITKALQILGDEIPIALLSTRWDKTNAEQIDEAWKKPNCRAFLHWRDIDLNGNGQIDYAVRSVVSMIADYKKLDIQYKFGPRDPIRILHISDVHTGGFDQRNLKLEANRCADSILEHWGDCSPTFIAFTGDVAEHGTPSQYNSAYNWIKYFFERLGMNNLPARNLLYVPGNHDFNLNLAAGERIEIITKSNTCGIEMKLTDVVKQSGLIGHAYAPFRNFLSKICDCPLIRMDINDNNLAWVESRFRHLGVIFYGINTAQPASSFCLPKREVNADALAQIDVKLKHTVDSRVENPPLVVGLGHHCPVSASGESAVVNPEIFDKFFRGRVKTALFLHGHTHEHDLSYTSNDGLRLVRSCATTFTKRACSRPNDSLRGFNLLNLERENHFVKSLTAFSYGWIGNDMKELKNGKWIRQNDGMFKEV